MGKKLDFIKDQSKKSSEKFKESRDLGQKAADEVKKSKQMIDLLPVDLDEEIEMAAKAVAEGTKSDAERYMHENVESALEAGSKGMEESTNLSSDQIKNNDRVKAVFEKMDSISNFGKASRFRGNIDIDRSNTDLNSVIRENNKEVNEAKEDFKKKLSDISNTF